MYPVHDGSPKDTVSCEGLFVLKPKEINVTRPCCHCSVEGNFRSEVIPGQLHKILGTVAELLGCGHHMDAMIQELNQFFLGELVLFHGKQDLYYNCSLLRVFQSR